MRPREARKRLPLIVILLLLLGLAYSAYASLQRVTLNIQTLDLSELTQTLPEPLNKLDLEFIAPLDGGSMKIRLNSPVKVEQTLSISDLVINCKTFEVTAQQVDCSQGLLNFTVNNLPISFSTQWHYQLNPQKLSLTLRGQNNQKPLSIDLTVSESQVDLRYTLKKLMLEKLVFWGETFDLPNFRNMQIESGSLNGKGTMTWRKGKLISGEHQGEVIHVNATLAGSDLEGLSTAYAISLAQKPAAHSINSRINLSKLSGVAYSHGTLLEFNGKETVEVVMDVADQLPINNVNLQHFLFEHDSLHINFTGRLDIPVASAMKSEIAVTDHGQLRINVTDWQHVLNNYLLGQLIEYSVDDLSLTGKTLLTLEIKKGAVENVQANLSLDEIRWQNMLVNQFEGQLKYLPSSQRGEMSLAWDYALYEKLRLGNSQAVFALQDGRLFNEKPVTIPLADGALHISSLSIESAMEPGRTALLSAVISPISLTELTTQLGMPVMEGKLSAVIPGLRLNREQIDIGGAILVKAFDGDMVVKDLQIAKPFSNYAVLTGNVDFSQLDLKTVTRTFDFGRIEGRLNGWFNDLKLFNWRPVAFNACFQTPVDDDSRHLISQRAIDNLSSLGGASGALSRTFLRFFENFSYDRIGLCCQLNDDVCQMSGISPHPNGYYIVKGGGLPRIDIIGYQRRVDWSELVNRLKRIQGSNRVVVE